jgi:uncharacterized protein (TIGR03437 family)
VVVGAVPKRGIFAFPGLLAFGCITCYGQPVVQSVTDAASFGIRVAPGSLASIFGTNLASARTSASVLPLPTNLGGTSVEISGALVPLLYADTTQINFQVPSELQAGQATLIVHAPAGDSSSFTFTVLSQTPAIFQYGSNHAVAQNNDSAHSLNSKSAPAAVGSVITVYLTGQGAVDNAVKDGTATPSSPPSKTTATATAIIGVKNAPIQFLGLTPGFVGLAQANIQVPTLPSGDYPMVLTVGGIVSASAIVSVSGSGTPYTGPLALVGTASFSSAGVRSVALLGNTAYVCGANNIVVVDATNPAKPAVLGEFGDSVLNGAGTICAINSLTATPYLVDVVGPLASATGVGLAVFDLTSPQSPRFAGAGLVPAQYPYLVNLSFAGTYAFGSTSYFTFNSGNGAILAQTGEFLSFNFASPAAPQFLSVLTGLSDMNLKPAATIVNQTFAYICSSTATGTSTAGTGMLDVVNVGSPTSMYTVNQVSAPPSAILLSLDVSGNTLLAAGNTMGNRNPGVPDFDFTGNLTLTTMDISNTASPVVVQSFDTGIPANGTFHTAAFGNGVFAIVNNPPVTDNGGPASLMIVDARQPSSPVIYPVQTQFGVGPMASTSLGYLLAANSFGLAIYFLQ